MTTYYNVMGGLVEAAVSILSQSGRRAEVAAQNLANGTTPAFRRNVLFSQLVGSSLDKGVELPMVQIATDFRPGKLVQTDNPNDIAIQGNGYFALRVENAIVFSRLGQFRRDAEGHLVTTQGGVLQLADGSDAKIDNGNFEIREDTSLYQKGEFKGRIAIYLPDEERLMKPSAAGFSPGEASLELTDAARVTQGAYESSNVTVGDEMVAMMEALRRAESGQRVMNVYDDLLGRAVSVFGDSVR